MSLADLSSLGAFVSGVAVLVSLVYLSAQIRQNTKHMRAMIHQGRADRVVSQMLALAEPHMVEAWLLANTGSASPEALRERFFQLQAASYLVGWDDTVLQHEEGLISEERFTSFRNQTVRMLSLNPAFRQVLQQAGQMGSSVSVRFFSEIVAEAERRAETR